MTILALDPDLFWAATENGRCNYLLEDIAQKIQNGAARLALDGATLEEEFLDLYNQVVAETGDNGQLIIQIYGPVAKGFRNRVEDLASDPVCDSISALKQTLEEFLTHSSCQEPVEPELIRMAYRGRRKQSNEDVVIVLVGDDILCSEVSLRSRGLNAATPRIQLEKLRIRVQSVTNLVPPVRDLLYKPEVEPSHYHSQNFERAVCIKMHALFGAYIFDPVPLKQLDLAENEDIDVYLYERTGSPRKVWIAECRLYKEGNESEWIESKKVKQLSERLPKVKTYEGQRQNCTGEVEIHGLLVSNAGLIDLKNWQWLVDQMKEQNIQVHFYQAILERGWSKSEGKLHVKELKHVEAPFDESYYSDEPREN
ncbi:MAG: hypothetical protein HND44_05185 [Chloroflexi bacterium]|nr:hypothetical protein [Ardenticatenaceae bacterium]MBL1127888.1 hypothetical protein [Chloroflexota bacterium]NOG33958.1 hypothetical protein [Chloroflexota bacterium]GIK55642.1 MAG: hypothetical protein BroJett015_13050 [Chloroflexota bacterium]